MNKFNFNKIEKESLTMDQIRRDIDDSIIFRNILIHKKYIKFDGKKLKGELCYDSYYKDFLDDGKLKYTIYYYCYDLKGLTKNPEIFEYSAESQIESEKGVIGLETIQWNFITSDIAEENIEYFENQIEMIWRQLGKKLFPN